MSILSIFTVGELLAITMLVLQLILVTVMLRDKRLWRIRQNSKLPSAARGRLEGQSGVDRARRSADMELQPHGSSPGSSISSRSRFPRFIRSCRDSRALFEEQREELEAQLAQWPRMPRGCGAARSSVPVEPGLLGGRESPRGAGEGRPRASSGSAAQEDKGPEASSGLGSSPEPEQGSGCPAMAWFIPRDVLVAAGPEDSGSSSSSSSSSSLGLVLSMPSAEPWWGPVLPPARRPQALPAGRARGREPGRALGKLRARLGGCLAAWCSRWH
ncbi:uncharacterized protein LOC117245092 [Parus major]|uniref:uncharacterized protein LOC117245092 n=1 Tax=Parus major TaxID=9157 RepID=UPI00144444DB|nr:uncharacterized protein LOC117245092 [Parus major]